jgi:WD40 repeat protein
MICYVFSSSSVKHKCWKTEAIGSQNTVKTCFLPDSRLAQQENGAKINSLDFHRMEDLLVTAGADDTIHVYNTQTGSLRSTLLSRKYGVCHINCTHHPNAVLYASCKVCTSFWDFSEHWKCVECTTLKSPNFVV